MIPEKYKPALIESTLSIKIPHNKNISSIYKSQRCVHLCYSTLFICLNVYIEWLVLHFN